MYRIMASNYQDFAQFCHKNKVDMKNARLIRDVRQLFGTWQGDLYVLHPMQTRKSAGEVIQEASRRGLKLKYRDVSGSL